MANWTSLQNVKPGSVIDLYDQEYLVAKNLITDLEVVNLDYVDDDGRYDSDDVEKVSELVDDEGDDFNKHEHQVMVVREQFKEAEAAVPTQSAANLTADLRQQKLTQDLRNQVAGKASTSQADLTANLRSQISGQGQQAATSERAQAPSGHGVAELKAGAAVARADEAKAAAAQAALEARSAANAAERARTEVRDVAQSANSAYYAAEATANRTEQVAREVRQMGEAVEENLGTFARAHNALADQVVDLDRRVNQIETQQRLDAAVARVKSEPEVATTQSQGGNKSMKNILASFKNLFGKVEGQFALAITGGLAVRKGQLGKDFVQYDAATNSITEVPAGLTLDFSVPAFQLPAEPKDVKKGDVVVTGNGGYGFVTDVNDGFVKAVVPAAATQATVYPIKNILLGKSFYTVVRTLDVAGQAGFNPALLLAMGKGSKDDILPLLLATGGLNGAQGGAIDPTLLLALGDGVDDILPFVLMNQAGGAAGGLQGVLPLLLLSDKGGDKKDLLKTLALTGGLGTQAGAFNPLMLLALDGDGDFSEILKLQLLTGQNLFGAPAAPKAE